MMEKTKERERAEAAETQVEQTEEARRAMEECTSAVGDKMSF